jgi:hypothetical protein
MRTRFFIVHCCVFFFAFNSVVFAEDKGADVTGSVDAPQIARNDAQGSNLQKWLGEIKPAAGSYVLEKPKRVNYWEQKVVRRHSRGVSK